MRESVLVTGAASGIGLATARQLRREGWKVIGLDRREPPPALEPDGWIACDLAQPAEVERAVCALRTRNLGALVFSAGIAGVGPIEPVLRINFLAVRRMLRQLAPQVTDGGAITLVSSGAGWRWQERCDVLRAVIREEGDEQALAMAAGLCDSAALAYNCSKELLCALVAHDCLREWGRSVRLNSVSPGSVATPLIGDFIASMGADAMDFSRATVGRDGTPEEIAEVIAFLCSPRARWINGADIRVDGGLVGALSSGAVGFAGWE